MSNELVTTDRLASLPAELIEKVLIKGDLSSLSTPQKLEYYTTLARSLGLNPMTRPFEYLILNNKLVLYVKKDATEQLRKLYNVSVKILDTKTDWEGGTYDVIVEATDYSGRKDTGIGSASIFDKNNKKLQGNDLANAKMKAETKAKRRATLSIVGLGLLSDAEIEGVATARQVSWQEAMQTKEGETVTAEQQQELMDAAAAKGITAQEIFTLAGAPYGSPLTVDQVQMLHIAVKMREDKNAVATA
jgi:hypothetical protein